MSRIDLERFRALEADRLINIQEHPEGGLYILNYTPKAQYERNWSPEMRMARGLITDLDGVIVSRPFLKFFNLGEENVPLPEETFEVYDKLDGSLGILYPHGGAWHIATRGSFRSEQSARATQILRSKYAHVQFDPSLTYLFEIIYPENRIVVNYGDREDLILIAVIETATGRELPLPEDLGMPLVKRYDGLRDVEALANLAEENREGFVVRFAGGYRVKVKFEDYKRLHRVLVGVNLHSIWEILANEGNFDALLDRVPDEFYQWVKDSIADFQARYAEIEAKARAEYREAEDRKATAAYFMTCTWPHILFRMLDGKPYAPLIWRELEPDRNERFYRNDEEG